ncbi:unnamed protein product [Lathyrus sativus]|nr:unnamed protein product [Lathyrus sativus]
MSVSCYVFFCMVVVSQQWSEQICSTLSLISEKFSSFSPNLVSVKDSLTWVISEIQVLSICTIDRKQGLGFP